MFSTQISRPFQSVKVNQSHQLKASDNSVLVHKDTDNSWTPIDRVEESLGDATLQDDYGLWKDTKLTSGHLWWKETVREQDGEIQSDEVKSMAEYKRDSLRAYPGGYTPSTHIISSVAVEPAETGAILHETWLIS